MLLVRFLTNNLSSAFLKPLRLSGFVLIILTFFQLPVLSAPFPGSGTVASPYLITTPAQMDSVRKYANNGTKFKLMNDLDLTAVNWIPISYMQACFDGNGHKIKYSLTASNQSRLGLFGWATDTIQNLTVEATISASGSIYILDIGGLVGRALGKILNCHVKGNILCTGCCDVGGLAGYTSSQVSNCSFTGTVKGELQIGGLIGTDYAGTVYGCSAKGTVIATYIAGGLISETLYDHVSYCVANCNVTCNAHDAGGFVGYCTGNIDHCCSTGNVTGVTIDVGGFVGRFVKDGAWSISACYSTGTVNCPQNETGGFAGSAENNINNCYSSGEVKGNNSVGGFAGNVYLSSVSACYSVGAVEGTQYFAGLIGVNNGTTTSGYFDKITSWQSLGTAYNGGTAVITGATTAQMKMQNTFQPGTDWNFTTTWQINEGYTYPVLRGINNAPFAFRDTLLTLGSINLAIVTSNDYDFETGQTKLVYKIVQIYGTGTVNNDTYFFPGGSAVGFTDSVLYRIGELLTPGDTLWGNTTRAIIKKGTAGNGTASNPYLIYSPQDMDAVRNHLSSNFKLMADLDLTADYPNWVPVGVGGASFTGTFNGNGHAIKYQISNSSSYAGLFGVISGTINNLSVDANITSINDYIGGLVGQNNSGTISNCSATGSISGGSYIGGLLGNNGDGSITSCNSSANVSGTGERIGVLIGQVQSGNINDCSAAGNATGDNAVGGLIGLINGNVTNCHSASSVAGDYTTGGLLGSLISGNITNCYSRGSVSCNGYGGGLIGFCNGGTITNCNSAANVVVNGDYAGGLIGQNAGALTFCYSTGSVTGNNIVGGLIGDNTGDLSNCYSTSTVSGDSYVGGLMGDNNAGVSNCYSTGRVTGNSKVGGLVGQSYGNSTIDIAYSAGNVTGNSYTGGLAGANLGTITSGYYDTNSSGQSLAMGYGTGNVTGLNTTNMKKAGNFSGLNFTTIWQINENHTYPALLNINNAPFAFRSTVFSSDTIHLTSLLANDYDIETVQTKLVIKVLPFYGWEGVYEGKYLFPYGSTAGFTDSLLYRVGEVISATDTLWGNVSTGILKEIAGLSASPATAQFRAIGGSSSFNIHSNVSWNVVSSATWLTLGTLSGTVDTSVSLTASENTSGTERNATVTISATGLPDVVINVKQAAKIPLTFSINAQNKAYNGSTDASVTISSVSGKLPADVVTINATGHFDNKRAGTGKTVTVDITLSGADAGNYICNTQLTTTANITKIPLVMNVSAKNRMYDGTTTAEANTSITGGLINGDDVSIVAAGIFNSKNIGYRNATFNISLTGADAGNYTITTPVTRYAYIVQAKLDIQLSVQDKVYDGTTDASTTATIVGGLVAGEDVVVTINSSGFFYKTVSNNADAYGYVSISGSDVNNYYSDSYIISSAKITPLPLTIVLNAENKTYNGNTNVNLTANITSGLLAGDTVNATAYGAFIDKNVGTGKTVNANIYLGGKDMVNYSFNSTGTTTADITKANLSSVVSVSPNKTVYTGGETVTFTATYPNAIDVLEGTPSINLTGTGINTVGTMTSSDRITWTYQWTPPVTGNGRVDITVLLADVAGNFNQTTTGVTYIVYENSTSGIADIKSNDAIKVYPTVNNGSFHLAIDNPDKGLVHVRIINTSGVIIKECQFIKASSSEVFEVIMGNDASGTYMIEIVMNGIKEMRRIIKE